MDALLKQIEHNVGSNRLICTGDFVLVAVSGGLDSMALLHALHELAPEHGWRLAVAHFNHKLRGRQSEGDERFVKEASAHLGLEAVVESADVKTFARTEGISIEMAARRLRHDFFVRAAKRLKLSAVALAHHADDQVELFFLRLLRGTGGAGIAGMKWRSPSPADASIHLVRPLLDQPKDALRDFATTRGILFREDATNAQVDFQRNRIRHELLPLLLEKYQPALQKTVLRFMEIAGEEAGFVTAAARQWFKSGRPAFSRLHVAVQRRCLQIQLLEQGVAAEFDCIELLRHHAGKTVNITPSLSVWRDQTGRIRIRRSEQAAFNPNLLPVEVSPSRGEVFFDGVKFSWHITRHRKTRAKAQAQCEFFDADKVGERIILRHWQPGDRFQPIGAGSPGKLQDLFVNQKIPRARRHELVVAETTGGEIFWVEELRISERFKLDKSTVRRFQWQWTRSVPSVAGSGGA